MFGSFRDYDAPCFECGWPTDGGIAVSGRAYCSERCAVIDECFVCSDCGEWSREMGHLFLREGCVCDKCRTKEERA